MARMVQCVKLGREAEGMRFKPFRDELGQRLFDNVSQEAWQTWLQYSTMLINEYRLDLMSPHAQKILRSECERFFFSQEAAPPPPDYLPPSENDKK